MEGQQHGQAQPATARCPPAWCGRRRGRGAPRRRRCRCGCRSRGPPAARRRLHGANLAVPRGGPRKHGGDAAGGSIPPVDTFFKITERGSTVAREVRGGVVTFFTMAYIIVLNPLILGLRPGRRRRLPRRREPPGNLPMIAAGTALVAGVMTILMGVVANFPLALATGLGLNAFVAFAIASQMTWADAMGLVVLEGLVILVLVLTGFREAVFHAVPAQLKIAISVGHRPVHRPDRLRRRRASYDASPTPPTPPCPCSSAPAASSRAGRCVVFCLGLVLVVALWVLRVKGAILISILATTVVAVVVEAVGGFGRAAPTTRPAGPSPCPSLPEQRLRRPRLRHAGRVQPARVVRRGRRRRRDPARLHADARRLLRHDGHDDRDRRRGRPARRRGRPAAHPPDPRRRLGRRRGRWRRRRLVQHLLHRVGLRRRRGGAHRPRLGRHRRAASCCRSSWPRSSR